MEEILKQMQEYSTRHNCNAELTLKSEGNGYVGDARMMYLIFEFTNIKELEQKLKG
jgi:hypothetical protein